MKYSAYLALIGSASSKFQFGFCDYPDQMEIDKARFEGSWYEIQRDTHMQFWNNQDCPLASYYPTANGMALEREYYNFFGAKEVQGPLAIREDDGWFSDGKTKVDHFWTKLHHYVIDTDYENYAVVFGCDQWFGFWEVSWATLLSRSKTIDTEHTNLAKKAL